MPNLPSFDKSHAKIKKPDAVLDYVENMHLVDKPNVKIGSVECI